MHNQSKAELQKLALQCLTEHGEDAWTVYRDEARARYNKEDDGKLSDYNRAADGIFDAAKAQQGCPPGMRPVKLRGAEKRLVNSGRAPQRFGPIA